MEDSILKSTKKLLGLTETDTAFDLDLLMFINSAFSTLNELGVLPLDKINVSDAEAKWSSLGLGVDSMALVKIYTYLKVRMLFDPPTTSFLIEAAEKILREQEWRLKAFHDSSAAETYAPEIEEVV